MVVQSETPLPASRNEPSSTSVGYLQVRSGHHVRGLLAGCHFAMTRQNDILEKMGQICDLGDSSIKLLVSHAVKGLCEYDASSLFDDYDDGQDFVDIFILGLKFDCPLLRNMAMDKLREVMVGEESVFSVEEVNDIFYETKGYENSPIRLFCAALVHFQITCSNDCPDGQILDDVTAAFYHNIKGFSDSYETYESKIQEIIVDGDQDDDIEWDPRVLSGWGKCDFHDHIDDEVCHLPDDDIFENEGPATLASTSASAVDAPSSSNHLWITRTRQHPKLAWK
ncbi:hypothetical protein BKA64DRAFT_481261 [Cadophora sp. MPI-SDFR-AT-0126]|nr:hypothetical protein BKA64DRAFT_481261 [Leotiomycetes sp. MPI-SDFR-AT-0126]